MNPMRGRGWGEAIRRLLGRRRDGLRDTCLDLELELDETWSVVAGRSGIEVRCTRGLVMITREGDPEDHVLPGGGTFVASRPGRVAIWAFQPARLRISAAGEAARCRGGEALAGGAPDQPLAAAGPPATPSPGSGRRPRCPARRPSGTSSAPA
jgi:hypothetical protein